MSASAAHRRSATARRLGGAFVLLVAALAPSRRVAAQSAPARTAPSAYIPLDDPATPIIDAMVARGELPLLSALERPYRARDLARAVRDASSRNAAVPAAWLRDVRTAIRRYDSSAADSATEDGVAIRGSITPFVTAQTTGHRELMLADSSQARAYPGADLRLALQSPVFVAVTRARIDRAFKADPEFLGKADRVIAGRIEDAYIATRWRYVALDVGRVARNWGPAALNGLQLGHYTDSYDQVQLVLGVDRLHLTSIAARLDDRRFARDSVAQRFFSIHRLAGRWRSLELAAAEAVVYGGVSRGFDLGLANPVGFYDLAQYDEHKSLNASYAFDIALRTTKYGLWATQFLVDDFQIDHCDSNCKEPPSLGLTLSAEGVPLPLGSGSAAFASYTRVDNLTYRTILPWERYENYGVGLGRGQSDYDELRAGVELAPPLGGPLRLYGAFRRQGQGSYNLPFPTLAQYPTTPEIFAGVVEKVRRVGAQWSVSAPVSLLADLGWQSVANADHVSGRTRSGVVGRVKLSIVDPLHFAGHVSDE